MNKGRKRQNKSSVNTEKIETKQLLTSCRRVGLNRKKKNSVDVLSPVYNENITNSPVSANSETQDISEKVDDKLNNSSTFNLNNDLTEIDKGSKNSEAIEKAEIKQSLPKRRVIRKRRGRKRNNELPNIESSSNENETQNEIQNVNELQNENIDNKNSPVSELIINDTPQIETINENIIIRKRGRKRKQEALKIVESIENKIPSKKSKTESISKTFKLIPLTVTLVRCDEEILKNQTNLKILENTTKSTENEKLIENSEENLNCQNEEIEESDTNIEIISESVTNLEPIENDITNEESNNATNDNNLLIVSENLAEEDDMSDFRDYKKRAKSSKSSNSNNNNNNNSSKISAVRKQKRPRTKKNKSKKSEDETSSQRSNSSLNTTPGTVSSATNFSQSTTRESVSSTNSFTQSTNTDSEDDFVEPRRDKKYLKMIGHNKETLSNSQHIRIGENKSYTIMHKDNVSSYIKSYDNDTLKAKSDDIQQQATSVEAAPKKSLIIERKDYIQKKPEAKFSFDVCTNQAEKSQSPEKLLTVYDAIIENVPPNVSNIQKEIDQFSESERKKMQNQITTIMKRVNEKREKLDALKRVTIYKAEHNIDHLRDFILKIRRGLQEALVDLLYYLKNQTETDYTMESLLKYYRISNELVGYNVEDDSFV